MAAEAGHHPGRCYIDQSGDFHLNSASFFNDAEADISASLEVLNDLAPSELNYLDGVSAGTITASKAVVADSNGAVADADLFLESTNEINVTISGVSLLAIDDSAISSNAGASATAGKDCYVETQDGGAGTGAGTAGGSFSVKAGDAGAAAAGTGNAGAAGGSISIVAGAASDIGTQASGTANGGAGGSVNITAGAGGDGGDSSGTDGAGGDIVLTPGAAGSGGNAAARAGLVSIPDGKIAYIGAIAMPGTTEGTNWLGIDVGTAPAGTVATGICVYTNDGDNLSFLHADGTTDDLGS